MPSIFKKYLNYILDLLLILSGFASLASSYILWFILPRGMGLHRSATHCVGGGTGLNGNCDYFLGKVRYTWVELHNWTSVVLAVIVLIHIVLQWNWIVETTRRVRAHIQRQAIRILELYGSAVVLLVLFLFDSLSGLVLWLVLPRGVGDYNQMINDIGRTFLGLQRNMWFNLHAWVAVTIVSIILVHLIMNWSWVVGVTRRIFLPGARSVS